MVRVLLLQLFAMVWWCPRLAGGQVPSPPAASSTVSWRVTLLISDAQRLSTLGAATRQSGGFESNIVHRRPYAQGIAASLTNQNGQAVAFVAMQLWLVASNNSNVPLPAFFTGTTQRTDIDGRVNFTSLKIENCTSDSTTYPVRVCPLVDSVFAAGVAGSSASSSSSSATVNATCSAKFILTLVSNNDDVSLRYSDEFGSITATPQAAIGEPMRTFAIELLSSCGSPLAPSLLNVPVGDSGSIPVQELLAIANVSISGGGLSGATVQPVSAIGQKQGEPYLVATFYNLIPTVYPPELLDGVAGRQSFLTATVTLQSRRGVKGSLTLRITVLPAPTAGKVTVSAELILLTPGQAAGLLAQPQGESLASRLIPIGYRPDLVSTASSDLSSVLTLPRLLSPAGAPRRITTSLEELRKRPMFIAIVMNVSACRSPPPNVRVAGNAVPTAGGGQVPSPGGNADITVPLPRDTLATANNTFWTIPQFSSEFAPRGVEYMISQGEFIAPLQMVFLEEGPTASRTTTTSLRFLLPLALGPSPGAASALTETAVVSINPNLLRPGYAWQSQAPFTVVVSGLPLQDLVLARRYLSLSMVINPDIAYVSVVAAVTDCTLDGGAPLDLALHPLGFIAIGDNQLTRFLIGAALGNSLLIGFVLLFGLAAWFIVPRFIDPVHSLPDSTYQRTLMTCFPHSLFAAVTVLFPGQCYSAMALLPYTTGNFSLVAWALVAFFYTVGVPVVITRVALKIAPRYVNVDVHQISSWVWKTLVPLGEYEGQHRDNLLYRYCYAPYRGPMRAFHAVHFVMWTVAASLASRFMSCRWRFTVPLAMDVVLFFVYVTRAPYVTANRNVVAVFAVMMRIIALSLLFWEGAERRSVVVLSSLTITLCVLSVACFIIDTVYAMKHELFKIGVSRGFVDEGFLEIVPKLEYLDPNAETAATDRSGGRSTLNRRQMAEQMNRHRLMRSAQWTDGGPAEIEEGEFLDPDDDTEFVTVNQQSLRDADVSRTYDVREVASVVANDPSPAYDAWVEMADDDVCHWEAAAAAGVPLPPGITSVNSEEFREALAYERLLRAQRMNRHDANSKRRAENARRAEEALNRLSRARQQSVLQHGGPGGQHGLLPSGSRSRSATVASEWIDARRCAWRPSTNA